MSTRYRCGQERRRQKVLAGTLNGIDYLEVHAHPGDPSQPTTLEVVFLKPDGVAGLTAANVRVEGGVRFRDPPVRPPVATAAGSAVMTVTMAPPGPPPAPQFALTDHSTYRFRLVDASGSGTPAGFDPELCAVDFSFKVECPSPFDCAPHEAAAARPATPDPALDYGARDWPTFRQLMLDRIAALLPVPPSDNPVDLLVTQVEALASVADHLSYRIDAVATERNLFTARSRISLARHARLLDYVVHEGSNARTFVHFRYEPGGAAATATLPAGTPVTTARPGVRGSAPLADYAGWLAQEPLVFETLHDVALREAHNEIAFHTWSDEHCVLPAGAVRATLRRALRPGDAPAEPAPGDFLLLQQVADPATGRPRDDRRLRHVVRLTAVTPSKDPVENVDVLEVAWPEEDRLPFDLVVSIADPHRAGEQVTGAVARANIALADHGTTLPPRGATPSQRQALTPTLEPAAAPEQGAWRPTLSRADVARLVPAPLGAPFVPAARLRETTAAQALPALSLADAFGPWQVRPTLLASQRFGRDVVAETESDGRVMLRFGDGVLGLAPAPGARLDIAGRFGRPADGRIGADVLRVAATDIAGVVAVTNPLAAFGGADPVDAAAVRLEAPEAFREQRRAVTEADWARVARQHPGVQDAVARIRWTGAWRTAFVYIDREGGLPVEGDAVFLAGLREHLERHRLAGGDVTVRGAVPVPLDITVQVCVAPGRLRAEVLQALHERLGSRLRRDGQRGFFHADNFSFGQPLYLSALLAAASEVDGVASVAAIDFRRWAQAAGDELARGVMPAGDVQVLRLANDPDFPEQGRLAFELVGGA